MSAAKTLSDLVPTEIEPAPRRHPNDGMRRKRARTFVPSKRIKNAYRRQHTKLVTKTVDNQTVRERVRCDGSPSLKDFARAEAAADGVGDAAGPDYVSNGARAWSAFKGLRANHA